MWVMRMSGAAAGGTAGWASSSVWIITGRSSVATYANNVVSCYPGPPHAPFITQQSSVFELCIGQASPGFGSGGSAS